MYDTITVSIEDSLTYNNEKKIGSYNFPKIQERIKPYNNDGYRVVMICAADVEPTGMVYVMMEKNLQSELCWKLDQEHIENKKIANEIARAKLTPEEASSLRETLKETADILGLKVVPKDDSK